MASTVPAAKLNGLLAIASARRRLAAGRVDELRRIFDACLLPSEASRARLDLDLATVELAALDARIEELIAAGAVEPVELPLDAGRPDVPFRRDLDG